MGQPATVSAPGIRGALDTHRLAVAGGERRPRWPESRRLRTLGLRPTRCANCRSDRPRCSRVGCNACTKAEAGTEMFSGAAF